jgi:hypothetical protein
MDHIPHEHPYTRYRYDKEKVNGYFDRKRDATSVILHKLSANPEHKIKMLYELEKLK